MRKVLIFVLSAALMLSCASASAAAAQKAANVSDEYGQEAAVLKSAGILQDSDGIAFAEGGEVVTAQLVTWLGRLNMAEVDLAASDESIAYDGWSNGYMKWAADNGLISGEGQYDALTAEQMNQIIAAYCEYAGLDAMDAADDVTAALYDIYENSWTSMQKKARVLVTTDLEVDDINGIILSLLFANEYDIAGLVATAGMFHFEGDGIHTLAEITPNYRCEVGTLGGTIENAGQLKSFRPAEPHLIERLINWNYRNDYEFLSQNDPDYPDPDQLLSVAKMGNVQFEGDYREETEGSQWIEQCIMDGDPRPLYIQHWGGINTTVRALISIYEDYHQDGKAAAEWDAVLKKVTDKVRISGSGEDNCRADSGIDELFPGLKDSDRSGFFNYPDFFPYQNADEELVPYYGHDFLANALKFGHGDLMGEFHLMGDGQVIYGEPMVYQYGLTTDMFWSLLYDQGYSTADYVNLPILNQSYERYDWMCSQFGNGTYVNIGIREGLTHSENHYTAVMFDEMAARADWAVHSYEECNHAPVIHADDLDITAKAGDAVTLSAAAEDPDGNELSASWWIPVASCTYGVEPAEEGESSGDSAGSVNEKAEQISLTASEGFETQITVPEDAQPGDLIVVNFEVQDQGVECPMTRFAQFIITVTE